MAKPAWLFGLRIRNLRAILLGLCAFSVVALSIYALEKTGGGQTTLPLSEMTLPVIGWTGPLLFSSVALGFAVMAIIQVLKPPVRSQFHLEEIEEWLKSRPLVVTSRLKEEQNKSVYEFLRRVSPGESKALLELPVEQLTAQIQAASELALTLSDKPDWFVLFLLGNQIEESDGKLKDYIKGESLDEKDKARINAQLSYVIQRRLDALQIKVRRDWRRLLYALAFTLSFLLTATLAWILGILRNSPPGTIYIILLLSIIEGFFATVARDVVAIIERLRR